MSLDIDRFVELSGAVKIDDLDWEGAAAAGLTGFLAGGVGQCFFTDEEVAMTLWMVLACGVAAAREACQRVEESTAGDTGGWQPETANQPDAASA